MKIDNCGSEFFVSAKFQWPKYIAMAKQYDRSAVIPRVIHESRRRGGIPRSVEYWEFFHGSNQKILTLSPSTRSTWTVGTIHLFIIVSLCSFTLMLRASCFANRKFRLCFYFSIAFQTTLTIMALITSTCKHVAALQQSLGNQTTKWPQKWKAIINTYNLHLRAF